MHTNHSGPSVKKSTEMQISAISGRQMDCCPWAGNEPCPNLYAPPPFPSLPSPCLPATQSLSDMHAHDGRDTVFLSRTSLLLPLPSFLSPAARPRCPKPAMPAFWRAGGLSDGYKHACGEKLTSLSFPFSCCPGGGADVRHIPYLPLPSSFPVHPWRGPLAEPAPC